MQKVKKFAVGTVYLIHFDRPFHHSRHYIGWTSLPVADRLHRHALGNGARLLAVVAAAGIAFHVARIWAGTRSLERALKRRHHSARLCPMCRYGDPPLRLDF